MPNSEDQGVLDSDFLETEKRAAPLIDLRIRAVAFLLDYALLIATIYYTYQFIALFINNPTNAVIYTLIGVYSLLFVFFEHKHDGSIFKKLLKIKNVSMDDRKLGIHIFIFKLILRPIAFCIALVYLKLCFAILLWLFGIYKPLVKFLQGDIFVLWYDYTIKQMTVKSNQETQLL